MKTQTYNFIDGSKFTVYDYPFMKKVRSENYNYNFNKISGRFERCGKTEKDDPDFAPAPEILDIEVTTICNGIPDKNGVKRPCSFCYKSNTPNGKNMSLETFKKVIDRYPLFLTQIALGADSECQSNPEIFDMMKYARSKGIVPNITVANISDDTAKKLSEIAGAVAVSRYADKNVCYDSIKRLTDLGMKQINMHFMISEQTFEDCKETLNDILTDSRLKGLNAIVLLSLKKKGRGEKYTPLSEYKFKYLVNFCLEHNISFGMDSCSAPKFLNSVKGHKYYNEFLTRSEPCESGLFSSYINVEGKFYPCSFTEGSCGLYGDWQDGIDLTKDGFDFFKDLWFSDKVVQWRNNLLNSKDKCSGCRKCPAFDV
jgi:MoaA/NifB/PqqE/SkfB family radical SAM enzyme